MNSLYLRIFLIVIIITAILATGVAFFVQKNNRSQVFANIILEQKDFSIENTHVISKKLENPPEIIKSIYMTGYSAGSKNYLNYLEHFLPGTEINAVVVDIKGSDGVITYPKLVSDIDGFIKFFHDKNIYVIGRIVVFQDSVFAKAHPELSIYNKTETKDFKNPVLWKDNRGSEWTDPASKDVWNYNISLANDALLHGFDEINFDYIRFPSDGDTKNIGYPVWDKKISKADIIKNFFEYLRENLKDEKISADIFGQTTVNLDDMGIGQIIENAFLNFDYVCPMIYPSHYANGFGGFENPAEHPYEIVKYSLDSAVKRKENFKNTKLRPWLQDFNMGAEYNSEMVKQEIKATQDSLRENFTGYMLWNASNIYTHSAVLK